MEVGRSAVLIQSGTTHILVDYGVLIDRELGFPMHVPPKEVNAIILTHSHLDHCGGIPIFHIRGRTPVYGTPLSCEIAKLLITDLIHLSGYYLPYEYLDLQMMMNHCMYIKYRQPFKVGNAIVELLNSGHIPGSCQVIIEVSGRRILYTSDLNTEETKLMKGADQNYGKIDALIMESTYADENHKVRSLVEKEFMDRVNEVVERGGTVLVPAFSVGRSQEILCVLSANNFKHPVAFDGMAKDASRILMRYPEYLRDPKLFIETINTTHWIKGWRDRHKTVKKPGVIVSPAGMLKGGNAIFYMNTLAKDEKNAVFLISYQLPNSPGRTLMDTHKFIIGGKMRKFKADVAQFDFTSHCGRSQLFETAKLAGENAKVFLMHGAEGNCKKLAEDLRREVDMVAFAPKTGDAFQI